MEKKILFECKSKKSKLLDEYGYYTMPEENGCILSEVIFLICSGGVVITLTVTLFNNMRDDWTADSETRSRVFSIALVLFCINLFLCCYVARRMGLGICRPQYDIESCRFFTESTTGHLLAEDLPPSYDSVASSNASTIPPPTYEAITLNPGPADSAEEHHKATG